MVVPELALGGPGGSSPWEVVAFAELQDSCVGVNVRLSRSFALPRGATIPSLVGGGFRRAEEFLRRFERAAQQELRPPSATCSCARDLALSKKNGPCGPCGSLTLISNVVLFCLPESGFARGG